MTTQSFFAARRPHHGLTYDEYLELFVEMEAKVKSPGWQPADEEERRRGEFLGLNLQRTRRIGRTYAVGDKLREVVAAIRKPMIWMVLTEAWCGDSSQCLPVIAHIARCNSRINLRILLRDQNLDIMDQYLTDGKRSIPKLVAFDVTGTERFTWGDRPKAAAELFRREKAAGLPKEEILRKLHLWYGRDRGKSIEMEFLQLLD